MPKIRLVTKCGIFALATIITSCNSELESLFNDSAKQKYVTLTAEIIDDKDSQTSRSSYGSDGAFTWGTDEEIAVYSDGTFSEFTMTSGGGTNKATFSGTVAESVTSTYALYPYRSDYTQTTSKKGVTSINYVLPDTYNDYVPGTTQANLPMYSTIADVTTGEVRFYMTVGALRYTMKNLPAGTKSLTFVTDQNIAGTAVVNTTTVTSPYLEKPDGKQYVTYNFKDALAAVANVTIDVPIPAGTYKAFGVDIKDADGTILKSVDFTKDFTMETGHIQKISFDYASSSNAYTVPNTGIGSLIIVTPGKVDITSKDDYLENALYSIHKADGTIEAFGTMKVKGRGNSTWTMNKKPYKMKFDEKKSLLGEKKDKEWVLLANYMDKTQLRNALAFYMGRSSNGILAYSPYCDFVELNLNGEQKGSYQLTDQLKISESRVNVGDDGFLMEFDGRYDPATDVVFRVPHISSPVNIKDPDVVENDDNYNYIKSYVTAADAAIFSENFTDPETGYKKYIDINSFVEWYLINEIARNHDAIGFGTSCYMSLKRGEKLKMGPLWDYDIGFGNINYDNCWQTEGYWILQTSWLKQMFQDPEFREAIQTRMKYYYDNKQKWFDYIDTMAAYLDKAQQDNENVWHTMNVQLGWNYKVWGSYAGEITYLKDWLSKRIDWLYQQTLAWDVQFNGNSNEQYGNTTFDDQNNEQYGESTPDWNWNK